MEEWKECKLSDICDYGKDRVEVSSLDNSNYISTENMLPNRAGITTATALPTGEYTPSFEIDDTLVSNIRPYFKKIWKATFSGGCSADVLVFKAKENVSKEYLYYVLADDEFFKYSMTTSKGTKMPRGDKTSIMNYPIKLSPLPTQQKIAAILSSLDDKIELNNKINTNLEQQAQALFKNWFVDFEPFGGKMPEWWKLGKLSDIAEIKTDTFKPEQNPDIQVEHYSLPAFDEKRYPTFEISKELKSNKFIISNDEVLVSKLNPTVKRVWRPYCLTEKSICSTEFIVYKPISAELKDYLFSIVNSSEFNDFMCSNVTGSTNSHQRTPPKTTLNYEIPIPPKEILHKFCDIVTSMYDKIKENIKQNETVSSLRDTLLPKLMNEKIEI